MFASPEAGDRCPVRILDLYISKFPQEAVIQDLFYVRPLEKLPSSPSAPWYSSVAVGRHTLNKKTCTQAEVAGHKTNHSLRATGATQLYEKGAPEKLIQELTGHRSLEALRAYERHQHQAVSNLLSTTTNTHYMQEMQRVQTDLAGPPLQQRVAGPSQFPTSGFIFQNLQGCTINITTTPSSSSITEVTHQSVVEQTEQNTVVNN